MVNEVFEPIIPKGHHASLPEMKFQMDVDQF